MTSGVCCCGEKGYLSTCVDEECPPGMIVVDKASVFFTYMGRMLMKW